MSSNYFFIKAGFGEQIIDVVDNASTKHIVFCFSFISSLFFVPISTGAN